MHWYAWITIWIIALARSRVKFKLDLQIYQYALQMGMIKHNYAIRNYVTTYAIVIKMFIASLYPCINQNIHTHSLSTLVCKM